MIFIVSFTGTIVKSDSTSREARMPCGLVMRSIDRKSSVEFIWYCAGKYGVIIEFSC